MWYYIGFRKDGSISEAEYTSDSTVNGVRVVYVEADSKEQAIAKAKADWIKWREAKLRVATARGLCTECFCRPVKPKTKRCLICLKKRAANKREVRAIHRLPEPEKKAIFAERALNGAINRGAELAVNSALGNYKRTCAADERLDLNGLKPQAYTPSTLLRYVARAYDRDPDGFRDWLENEINKMTGVFKRDNMVSA